MADDKPYVVFEFHTSDPVEVEAGLTKWLLPELDLETMHGKIRWPPNKYSSDQITSALIKEVDAPTTWPTYPVTIKRYYDSYISARRGAKGFSEDSNYETEKELGRGRRKKRPVIASSSDSDNDIIKCGTKKKKTIADILELPLFQDCDPKSDSVPEKSHTRRIQVVIHNTDSERNLTCSKVMRKSRTSSKQVTANNTKELLEKIKSMCEKKASEKVVERDSSTITVAPGRSPIKVGNKNVVRLVTSNPTSSGLSHSSEVNKKSSVSYIQFKKTKSFQPSSSGILFTPPKAAQSCISDPDSPGILKPIENLPPPGKPFPSPSSRDTEICVSSPDSFASKSSLKRMSPISDQDCSGPHKRVLFTSPLESPGETSTNGSYVRLLETVEELSSKIDIVLINQAKIIRALLPHEKRIVRPPNLPALPLRKESSLLEFEKFLKDESSFSATVDFLSQFVSSNPNEGKSQHSALWER